MKAIKLYIYAALFITTGLVSALITGCSKERKTVATNQTDFTGKARVQVYNDTLISNRN